VLEPTRVVVQASLEQVLLFVDAPMKPLGLRIPLVATSSRFRALLLAALRSTTLLLPTAGSWARVVVPRPLVSRVVA
jgi:hypothetical protein